VGIDANFKYISNLQYEVHALKAELRAFESGERYTAIREENKKQLAGKDRTIKKLKADVIDAERRIEKMRKNWMQVYEDIEAECVRKLAAKDRDLKAVSERALRAERRLDKALALITKKDGELRRLGAELKEEKDRCQKLKSQINRDYENSSIPSSANPNHKKIANGRETTGKRPGGQPGHRGHVRKRHEPTNTVTISPPEEYTNSSKYRPTGKTVVKQLVGISTVLVVTEYKTPEFRKVSTGQRVHAAFPPGVINDVNYDGSIKALAFLLNSRYCVATDKIREFLFEITGGKLQLSNGMINGLGKEFSLKTAPLQKEAFRDILLSPVLNTDFTNTRIDATSAHVIVCATPNTTLYFARWHKGHEGIMGTPVKDYQGILVHDHDKTYYSYASSHQECLSHIIRYLKNSIENEPGLTWNVRMLEQLRKMIHYRNGLGPGNKADPFIVADFEAGYKDTLVCAEQEYGRDPPSRYYRDGYNLYRRLDEYAESHLLFLHDLQVPSDNNRAERMLRIFKRKQRQAMSFRSFENLGFFCDGLGIIASLRQQEQSLLPSMAAMFNRVAPHAQDGDCYSPAVDCFGLGPEL